ncbi:uncharacterized protein EDB91DRAFT_1111390 [Suillus paluster]|uniref:uncharacterized protein n=1 Tax=Suillus paluster TaxID=48578 RepID=UPI001B864D25|nr:uncharacterized protein EDB91DRAFT_1111390 [Suillus paluster]KAG1748918.1 hypothetical protein EDB91DRAFT_1111390 [Suillus paluster]
MTSYPPPIPPPKRYDLVEAFDAMALAGKPNENKRLHDLPPAGENQASSFIGGFSPEKLAVNAMLDATKRPPIHSGQSSPHSKGALPPLPKLPTFMTMPFPQTGKQSLTMQHALNTTMARVTSPSRPQSDSLLSPGAMAHPSISATVRSRPVLDISPGPRSASVPPSPLSPSANKNTAQCSGMTKAGKQCSRQVKLPSTHCYIDPMPVVYCHQHRDAMFTAQTGFYVRRKGKEDTFVEFSNHIPQYLQRDTQLALRVEMEKAASPSDVPGYIYTYEIRDPKRPNVIQLKVGRAVNLAKRLDQWDKQCGSKVQIVRGWWPGTVEDDDDGTNGSLLKGNIKAGEPGPLCHRVERLVHIELADLVVHTPYLDSKFPKADNSDMSPSGSGSPKKATMKPCLDCGAIHREIFAFPRPTKGRYKGREWDLLVKPVIEKWGKFVSEHYA